MLPLRAAFHSSARVTPPSPPSFPCLLACYLPFPLLGGLDRKRRKLQHERKTINQIANPPFFLLKISYELRRFLILGPCYYPFVIVIPVLLFHSCYSCPSITVTGVIPPPIRELVVWRCHNDDKMFEDISTYLNVVLLCTTTWTVYMSFRYDVCAIPTTMFCSVSPVTHMSYSWLWL